MKRKVKSVFLLLIIAGSIKNQGFQYLPGGYNTMTFQGAMAEGQIEMEDMAMANVIQIAKSGGSTYIIKDATARQGIIEETTARKAAITDLREEIAEHYNSNVLPEDKISDVSQRYASGIKYTVNKEDGSVTASGTAIYDAWIHLYPAGSFDAASGVYYLSGCPEGGYIQRLEKTDNVKLIEDTGSGEYGHIDANLNVRVVFIVPQGKSINTTFTPKLTKITESGEKTEAVDLVWDGSKIQYWNNNKEKTDKYYLLGENGAITINSANGYRINCFTIQKGDIYYKNLSGAFTIVADLITGTATTLQNGYGKPTYLHDGHITVDHPVCLFATSNDVQQPLVVNSSEFPSEYIYGIYYEKKHVTVSADGTGDFETLKQGLEFVERYENAIVDVMPGTYDLITEFGNDYFSSMSSSSSEMSGLKIGRGITVNFMPGSKVKCDYTGDNEYARSRFSPFNFSGGKGYTLIGLDLECSNVRYAIHDEANNSDVPYRNQYIDCRIIKDNSENTDWRNPLVIGGGLGVHGHVDIVRCYFKGIEISGIPSGKSVNYHNASSENAKSILYVEGCYFDSPYTVGLSYYGSSQEITRMQVNGCSLPDDPYINREGSASIENVEIQAFCNEIR